MCPRIVEKSRLHSSSLEGLARLWLVLVGVNRYQDDNLPSLQYSALDCQGLGEALKEATQSFRAREVITLHDFSNQQPNLETLRQNLQHIVANAQPEDTILLYFSGHGVLDPQTQQVFLCLADTIKAQLTTTGLAIKELLGFLSDCRASQQIVWLDACHSGGMTLRGSLSKPKPKSLANPTPQLVKVLRKKAAQSQGFYAFLSCDQTQQSWEFPELGHGVFTYYLMRGLRGEAADAQGTIEADALYQYVYHQTLRYIDKTNQQIRLINQQKSSRGERQLQSEYPLQTPKRIMEGFGKVILGKRSPAVSTANPRQALVVDGLSDSKFTLALSKIWQGTGKFALNYFPQRSKPWSEVKKAIKACLSVGAQTETFIEGEATTALLYLRGQIEETDSGESWLVLKQGLRLSRSWLRKLLRDCQGTQQIIILDCPGATSLAEWVEDLALESELGQFIIAAAAPLNVPQQFTHALLTTLKQADLHKGLPVAAWISQLQVQLAGTKIKPQMRLSGIRGAIEVLPGRGTGHKIEDSGAFALNLCPYMGLQAFTEENAQYFYGRESLVQKLLNHISHQSTLALVGASGSGKSSVVEAGIIAQLRQGKQVPGSEQWWIGCFRPSAKPLQALTKILVDCGTTKEQAHQKLQIEGLLYQGVEGFVQWLRNRPEPMVVLVIDQFEELFTLAQTIDRQQFLELILGAVKYASDRFKLILTVRADFTAACLEIPELAKILQQSSVLVPPYLTEENYRSAIIKPAEQVGLRVEAGLVEVLLKELDRSPGDLPLLQFVLQQLWERRQGGKLTLATYQQLGGIKGSLERQAQSAYENLDPEAQDCARWIFMNLTQLGEGTEDTRRRVSKSELIVTKYPLPLVERTLAALTTAKIVVVNLDRGIDLGQSRSGDLPPDDDELLLEAMQQEVTVEVVHEILIRHWSTLRWWLEENRTRLRSQRQIEQSALLWQQKDRQPDFLLRGVRLAEAEELYLKYTDELTSLAQEFIACGLDERTKIEQENKQRLRKTQIVAATLGILGLLATTSAGLAYRQKILAQIENISALNAFSESLLLSNQQLESLQTSVKAGKQLQQISSWGETFVGRNSWQKIKLETIGTLQQTVEGTQELNRLENHGQRVNAVSYSPDGELIATASSDRTIKIWHRNGKLLSTLTGHQNRVNALAFSANGKLLASASADNTIRLWSIANNNEVKSLLQIEGHQDWVTSVAFSPQDDMIASASRDGSIKIWQLDGKNIHTLSAHQGWVNDVTFAPNHTQSDYLLASSGEDGTIKLWSVNQDSNQQLQNIQGDEGRIKQITFSPDGSKISGACENGIVKLWRVTDGSLITYFPTGEEINALSYSPDGKLLATAGANSQVNIWNADGIWQQSLNGHGGQVLSLSFHPDGNTLASTSTDKTVRLWQVRQPAFLENGGIYSIAVSPISPEIFATTRWNGEIELWHKNPDNSRELLFTLPGHESTVTQIQFSPDGRILASASWDKTIKLWRMEDKSLIATLKGHQDGIQSIAFGWDKKGYVLASGSEDKTIKLWSIIDEQTELIATLTDHQDSIKTLAFNPKGRILASGSYDQTIKLWSREGELLQTLSGHNLAISTLVFSPDGNTLVSGSWDNTIRFWQINQLGKEASLLTTLKGHQNGVTGLNFNPEGSILASSSADGTIKLWHASSDHTLLKTLRGHTSPVNTLAFSDRTLISADEQQGLILWNLNLDSLLTQGCDRLSAYLKNNSHLTRRDRLICDH